jgi:type III restriction enzyme
VNLDREAITRFINQQGLLTYLVRNVKISSYLKSLLDLAGLLTQSNIYAGASRAVKDDVTKMIHDHAQKLRAAGKYEELEAQVCPSSSRSGFSMCSVKHWTTAW